MKVDVIGNYLVATGGTYDQSRWLGDQGWWYCGPRSTGRHAPALRALGVNGHVRYLPVAEAPTAARVHGVDGVAWSSDAERVVLGARTNIDASRQAAGDFAVPCPDGLTYRPYQLAGVERAVTAARAGQPGVLLGDEMGLGKTMQAIGTIAVLRPVRVLVLCLTSIKQNWAREVAKWLPGAHVAIAQTAAEVVSPAHADTTYVTIASYPALVGSAARATALRAELLSTAWDVLVLDEAHVLKNERTQTSRAVLGHWERNAVKTLGVVHSARFVLAMTGTPIQNKVRESLPLMRAVGLVGASGALGNEGRFLFRYCGPAKVWTGSREVTTFDGADNLPELQEKLRASGAFMRRLKRDVATELPPKLRTVIRLDGGTVSDAYAAGMANEMSFDSVMCLLTKTVSFEEIAAYRAALAVRKAPLVVDHVRDLLDALEPNGKVLVFGHHQTMLDALQREFGDMAIRIDGQVPEGARQGLVDRFQRDPSIRVAILSTRAAGTGLTLTAAASVVFAEADWNPAMCVQAEDRAHRIGQDAEAVNVQYLVLDGTLDAHVCRTMAGKMDIADMALDRVAATPAPAPMPPPPRPATTLPAPTGDTTTVNIRVKGREEVYTFSRDQADAAREALVYMRGCCDGAVTRDDVGFNGRDAQSAFVGGLVNAALANALTPKQVAWALKILRTYSATQLSHMQDRLWPSQEVV